MIKKAEFHSVWAGWDEDIDISSKCKVNMKTKEIFDIKMVEVDEDTDKLLSEYVCFENDPTEYPVMDYQNNNDYWYK